MPSVKKLLITAAAVSSMALGVTMATSGPALAYVACNGAGECWHADRHYAYDRGLGITMHNDAWRDHHRDDFRWRDDHPGRGYWRNGAWVTF